MVESENGFIKMVHNAPLCQKFKRFISVFNLAFGRNFLIILVMWSAIHTEIYFAHSHSQHYAVLLSHWQNRAKNSYSSFIWIFFFVVVFIFAFIILSWNLRRSHCTLSNVSLLRAFSYMLLIVYALLHREQIGLLWPRRQFRHPLCPESQMSWTSATFLMNLPGWYLLIHLPLCLQILTRYSR